MTTTFLEPEAVVRLPRRGFLPAEDPACCFSRFPEYRILDEIGNNLPELLKDARFRDYARELWIPLWSEQPVGPESLPELRLYYLRLGFIVSGYVNQVSQPPARILPANLAVPFAHACRLLNRPPILSYDGYALYNWRRFDPAGPIELGNIDTIQNFVSLYDEHWFILVHIEIEAIAAEILAAIDRSARAVLLRNEAALNRNLQRIADAVTRQVAVLRRIPEHMRPELYFREFRPYIRFFENVVYERVDLQPMNFRGETGAQSSIMPALVAFLKIKHRRTILTDHLSEMRRFMPAEHRQLLDHIEQLAPVRELADAEMYNSVLDAIISFREVHLAWADQYIHQRVEDPRGTGGTPYMQWLQQLIDETHAARK